MNDLSDWRKYCVVSISPNGSTFFSVVNISIPSFFIVMLFYTYIRVTSSFCYRFSAMNGKSILASLAGNTVLRFINAFIIWAFNFRLFICFVFYIILNLLS